MRLVFEDKLDKDIALSRSCAHRPFDRKHGIRVLLSVLSVVVDDPLSKHDGRTRNLPLPLPLPIPFFLSEGKVSLYIGLQLCANCWVKTVVPRVGKKSNCIHFSCLENRDIIQSNIFLVVVAVQSFVSDVTSRVSRVVLCLIRICKFERVVIITEIFNGSEVCVINNRSRFYTASVFNFLLKPTSLCLLPSLVSDFLGGEYVDVEC